MSFDFCPSSLVKSYTVRQLKIIEVIIEITNPSRYDVVFSMGRPISAELFNVQCTRTKQQSDLAYERII